jgi:hypothetical protein
MVRRKADPTNRADANTAQMRAAIPSGRTPTIDSAHEPAAASFDTDDEAAGRPAQRAAIQQALAHEGRVAVQAPGDAKAGFSAPLWVLAAVALSAVLAWIALS